METFFGGKESGEIMEAFLKEISKSIRESKDKDKSEEEIRKKYREIVKKYDVNFETARALIAYYFGREDKWVKIAAELSPFVTLIKSQIRSKIKRKLSQALSLHKEGEKILSKAVEEITSEEALNGCYYYLERGIYKDRERIIKILEKEIETLKGFGAWVVDKGIVIN